MGIDPSTRRMSAAVLVPAADRCNALGEVAFVVDTLSLPQMAEKNEARRLALAQREIVPWMGGLLTLWKPTLVVVETPFAFGRMVPAESFHVIGILLAVLGTFGVRVGRMGPSTWKKEALGAGRGGTKKPPAKCPAGGSHTWAADDVLTGARVPCVKCDVDYAVLTWAREAGYAGRSWDEADAVGLATAGGVVLERRARAA